MVSTKKSEALNWRVVLFSGFWGVERSLDEEPL